MFIDVSLLALSDASNHRSATSRCILVGGMRLEWVFRLISDNGRVHTDGGLDINGGLDEHGGVSADYDRCHHDDSGADHL